jgi:hypothetical protein
MQYLFDTNNGCTKAPHYYVIRTLPNSISLYKIPVIIVSHITLSMDIDFPYSVWGIVLSERNI